ncbi:MAG: hypothetical protein ACRD96_22155, partial [Bryobacteraceae bacterium]
VPPSDPESLAAALATAIAEGPQRRRARGLLARGRIADNFTLDAAASRYASIYEEVLEKEYQLCAA